MLAALLTRADAAGLINWEVSIDSTPPTPPTVLTSTQRTSPAPQGDLSNDKNLLDEPDDHAIGRSRGGLTTKIHALVDGNQRPLVVLLGPGQRGDSPMFEHLMEALEVRRAGSGRPRSRPDRAMADKAYSSKATRQYLRERGIGCVIPEKDDQKANRIRKGSRGGRPVSYDTEAYKRRNVPTEEHQHRGFSTQLSDRRERSPRIPGTGQELPDDPQMCTRGHWNELGNALHQSEDRCFKPTHHGTFHMDGASRRTDMTRIGLWEQRSSRKPSERKNEETREGLDDGCPFTKDEMTLAGL